MLISHKVKVEAFAKVLTKKKYNKSNLIDSKSSFYGYIYDKKFDILSFKTKYSYLLTFYGNLKKFSETKPTTIIKKKEKEKVYDAVTELYKKLFEIYYKDYEKLSDAKKYKLDRKFKPINLRLEIYNYDKWFTEEESDEKNIIK